MRLAARLFGLSLIAAVALVACASGSTTSAPQAATAVAIKGFAFAPAALDVAKGTTVTWTNSDSTAHTVTSGANRTADKKFDTRLEGNAAFSFTFDTPGTYEYFCQIHSSMKATVTVK